MANSLFQYWIESAFGLLLFWGFYRLARKRQPLVFRKFYLILTPLLAMTIPLLDWELPAGGAGTASSGLWDQWLQRLEEISGGSIQISGMGLLSAVYFVITAVLLFRVADGLERMKGAGRIGAVLEFIYIEGGWALFWFQPLLFLFRSELTAIRTHLQVISLPEERTGPYRKALGLTLPTIGLAMALAWLFSANQICHSPQWSQVESAANHWQARLEIPFFQLGSPREGQTLMGWGGYWTTFSPLSTDSLSRISVRVLSPFEYFSVSNQIWSWRQDGWSLAPISVEALVSFPFQSEPVRLGSLTEIQSFLTGQRFATEMTLILKMEDGRQRRWLGVIGISEKGRLYGYADVLQNWGVAMPLLHWKKTDTGRSYAELVPHSPYSLVWGDLNLPLDLRANPDVYSGYAAFDLEEFQRFVDQPLRFYLGDSLLVPESVEVREMDEYSNPNNFFSARKKLRLDGGDTFLDELEPVLLRPATTWTITASLPGEVEVNAINLYVRDTDAPYDPPLHAPRLPRIDSLYSFQLITRDGSPSILRIDTTLTRNQKILNMYRSNDAYRIIHIPGFESYDRLVQVPEQNMTLVREEGLSRDSIFLGDRLPEVPYAVLDTLYLEWGDLFAAPNSKVYLLEEVESQISQAPRLHVPGRELAIHSFVLYFFREDKPIHAEWYSPGRIAAWNADSLLTWIRPRTSLFIDQLVVSDEKGDLYAAPISFAFHIGKSERDIRWKVAIEEVPAWEVGETERIEEGQVLAFRNYRLSDLIPILALHPKNRMEFRGLRDDPVLNVQLTADGALPARAQDFLLNELQKRFRFEFFYERLDRPNWQLHLKDADLLNRSRYDKVELPEEKIRVFQWDGTHVLTGVTLNEMADHLEERFDEIIMWFPNAFQSDRYSFSLHCNSLSAVQEQLEKEYGIVFQRMDQLWSGMVVRFY
ncbi:MAG: hypothetical protein H6563_09800 [Lewinellaceae bacterium]|nr:hypothetical protein [Lewinellaceae bacterium]